MSKEKRKFQVLIPNSQAYDVTLTCEGEIFYGENDWPDDNRGYTYEVFDPNTYSYYGTSEPFESWSEAASMAIARIFHERGDE